jgi:asparagine synthase (glutamine-hydrolysing)
MGEIMSAIAGILHLNQDPINPEHIEGLMNTFRKFPADKVDGWTKDNLFFGCHAQWITPESIGEQLPFYNPERGLAITADAIIDNREELFSKLQIDQSLISVLPDSQLILLAYSKWGEDVPKHLIGDFAFMIWDEKKRKFFGARDFSGTRTLYYYLNGSKFAFSTLIDPLFTLPYIDKKVNEEWLAEFFAIPGMVESTDQVSTVYKDIFQVPPSHSITVENSRVKLARYCRVSEVQKIKFKTNEEYEEAFREVFQKAVKARVRTYGEVGSQLSGGLDSGSVVSFAARELQKDNKKLHTFSFIPEDNFNDWTSKYYIADESQFIKETVKYVGNIEDEYLDFKGRSPLTDLEEILSIMEMPYKFFENSYWLKGINERASNKGIKILLNGARGNFSISWGSQDFTLNYYTKLLKRLSLIELKKELDLYTQNFNTGKSIVMPLLFKKVFSSLGILGRQEDFDESVLLINPTITKRINLKQKVAEYYSMISSSNSHEVRKQHFDQPYFWNKTGTISTKLSLKYGVWDRDPTNDIRVIQYCLAIPDEQFAKEGLERSLIRRATKGYMPDCVRLNQQKRGIQCAEVIPRMERDWKEFIRDVKALTDDNQLSDLIDTKVLHKTLEDMGEHPKPELVLSHHFRLLTRCLIVSKFLKVTGKEVKV